MWTALVLIADLATSLAVSDRTELRVRAPGTASSASFDAETTLTTTLTAASPRWRFTLAYTPRLTLWDANSSARQPTLLHGGEARIEWLGRRTRLSLDQSASYGGVSFASFSLTPGPEGQPPRVDVIPAPKVLELVSSTTTLASHLLWRRWTFDGSVGYQLSGGADAGARALLPLQKGPFGEARAAFGITRRDFVITTLSAREASFSSGPESALVEIDEGFRHLWSRITETRLTLGASAARARASATGAFTFEGYPVLEAVYERREAGNSHVGLLIGARLGPVVNQLIGLVDQRVQGTLAASHTYRRLATHVLLSASQSVPARGVNATSLFAGELGFAYGASRAVALDTGFRGFWQRQEAPGASFLQATVFVGVTLRAPPMRL